MAARKAKKHHPRHDVLVAALVAQPEYLLSWVRFIFQADVQEVKTEIEYRILVHRGGRETGRSTGWADILISCKTELECCGLLIEVKSQLEQWTAGDVIRQLKGYAETLRVHPFYPKVACAFYCDRSLTEAEDQLFAHEGIFILK